MKKVLQVRGQGKEDVGHQARQKQRWLATALLDIEPTLRRIKGCTYLPMLRAALQRGLQETGLVVPKAA